jgi:hypothetical protein
MRRRRWVVGVQVVGRVRVEQQLVRHAGRLQRGRQRLGLVGRDDLVVGGVDDQGGRQPVGVEHRREAVEEGRIAVGPAQRGHGAVVGRGDGQVGVVERLDAQERVADAAHGDDGRRHGWQVLQRPEQDQRAEAAGHGCPVVARLAQRRKLAALPKLQGCPVGAGVLVDVQPAAAVRPQRQHRVAVPRQRDRGRVPVQRVAGVDDDQGGDAPIARAGPSGMVPNLRSSRLSRQVDLPVVDAHAVQGEAEGDAGSPSWAGETASSPAPAGRWPGRWAGPAVGGEWAG